jgi:peptidoglycan/LPS O-acetylase OafA/YrhL
MQRLIKALLVLNDGNFGPITEQQQQVRSQQATSLFNLSQFLMLLILLLSLVTDMQPGHHFGLVTLGLLIAVFIPALLSDHQNRVNGLNQPFKVTTEAAYRAWKHQALVKSVYRFGIATIMVVVIFSLNAITLENWNWGGSIGAAIGGSLGTWFYYQRLVSRIILQKS